MWYKNNNNNNKKVAHLLGSTLKNQQLFDDDWLVNFFNEPLQSLLTSLTFLCSELLPLKCWEPKQSQYATLQSCCRVEAH